MITLEMTMDPHSLKIRGHENKDLGLLLFHDWQYRYDPPVGHHGPIDLGLMHELLNAIEVHPLIEHRRLQDQREAMAKNSREFFRKNNIDVTGKSDKEVVELYLQDSKVGHVQCSTDPG